MIIGAHSIIYSKSPEEDRAFLRDVLRLPNVDVGDGWLIFGLPPSEVAVHPSTKNDIHEFYFMCEDVEALILALTERKVPCEPAQNAGWGLLTYLTLPGGGRLGVYEPRHARPKARLLGKKTETPSKRTTRKKKKKKAAKRITKRRTARRG